MKFSWQGIASKGIFSVLAPMEEVSDTAFRQLLISLKRPDIFFTEFTSIDGMFSRGKEVVLQRFKFEKNELPLIAQVWGKDISLYPKALEIVKEYGFSGIDINMGCPVKNVLKHGAGSALIKDFEKAKNIYKLLREQDSIYPISIKTRVGFNTISLDWIENILSLKPDAVTIHLRTTKELSKVTPHYELMSRISEFRDKLSPNTVLICNGDIKSVEQGEELCKKYGFNGYMIGREAVNNPYVFLGKNRDDLLVEDKINLVLKHTLIFEKAWGNTKNFNILKKFYNRYISNFDDSTKLKMELMNTRDYSDVYKVLSRISF